MKPLDHKMLKMSGIDYEYKDINSLKKHPTEKIKHFQAKSLLFYILRQMEHNVVTECKVFGGLADIVDLNARTQYELQNIDNPKMVESKIKQYINNGLEIILIPLRNLPKEQSIQYAWLKDFVIPD